VGIHRHTDSKVMAIILFLLFQNKEHTDSEVIHKSLFIFLQQLNRLKMEIITIRRRAVGSRGSGMRPMRELL
jgi:hypothetical protein